MPVTLQSVLQRSLRIAGITTLPGIIPNTDQFAELIPEMNSMLGGWSCNGHRIFSTGIVEYTLIAGRKIYTIGPGAELSGPRPIRIVWANLISAASPTMRQSLRVITDPAEWARISVPDDTSATPGGIYYDNSYGASGFGRIYMSPQAQAGDILELFAWLAIASEFAAVSDVVSWPPGYEDAAVWNFALRVAGLYPLHAKLSPVAPETATRAMQAIMTLNMRSPILRSEAANLNGDGWPRLSGSYSSSSTSGSGVAPIQFTNLDGSVTGTIDGTNATFALPYTVTTVQVSLNGADLIGTIHYTHSVATITFLAPYIPQPGAEILIRGWL